MKTYLIGYDERAGQDYTPLYQAIKKFGWWHHLDSTWLIKSDATAAQIRDYLWPFMHPDDKLLVMNVTGCERAWRGFDANGSNWLKDNV